MPRGPHTAFLGIALAAAVLLFRFDPATTWWFPSCPLKELTGWLCPFCGSLRAIHALFHGAPGAAWTLNPLTTAATTAAVCALALDAFCPCDAARAARLLSWCFSRRGLALALTFTVWRNIPDLAGWLVH
jgi:hypothetical protein